MRTLAAHRQVAPVAQPPVALNFYEPPDVHLNLFAEIAFDAALGFDLLAKLIYFFFGQILHFLGFVHVGLGADRPRTRLSNSIDGREADPQPLVIGQINSRYACHRKLLTLALLVLRVAANYPNHTAPMNDFALIANLFY
jgi:hypothetical protein